MAHSRTPQKARVSEPDRSTSLVGALIPSVPSCGGFSVPWRRTVRQALLRRLHGIHQSGARFHDPESQEVSREAKMWAAVYPPRRILECDVKCLEA